MKKSLFDLNRYVEEVEQVRIALKLDKNNFYLLGHPLGRDCSAVFYCAKKAVICAGGTIRKPI